MEEKFLITVDDSHRNISRTYSTLRNEKDFFDVTLVSEDGVHIIAHKVVLSASSQFFRTSFKKADHPKPMLFFSGINSNLLNSIVDFIYYGKVDVQKENIKSFFDVAEKFKLDGIPKFYDSDISNKCETIVDSSQQQIKEELIVSELDA